MMKRGGFALACIALLCAMAVARGAKVGSLSRGESIKATRGIDNMSFEELRREAQATLGRQKELVRRYHALTRKRDAAVARGDVEPDPPTNSASMECALPPDTNSACPPRTGATRALMEQAALQQQLQDQSMRMNQLLQRMSSNHPVAPDGNHMGDITALQSHLVSVQSRADSMWRDVQRLVNDVNLQQNQMKNEIQTFKMTAMPSPAAEMNGAPPQAGGAFLEEDENLEDGGPHTDVFLQEKAMTGNSQAIEQMKSAVTQMFRRLDRIQRAIQQTSSTISQNQMKNNLDMSMASEEASAALQTQGRMAQQKELQSAEKKIEPAAAAPAAPGATSLDELTPILEMMEKSNEDNAEDRREEERLQSEDMKLEEEKSETSNLERNVQNALSRVNHVITEGEQMADDDDVSLLELGESSSAPRHKAGRKHGARKPSAKAGRRAGGNRNGNAEDRPEQDMGPGTPALQDPKMAQMYDQLGKRQKQELIREAKELEREAAFEETKEFSTLSNDDRADAASALNRLVAEESERENEETQREKMFAAKMASYQQQLQQATTSLEEQGEAESDGGDVDVSQVAPEMTEPTAVQGESEAEGESEREAESEGAEGEGEGEAQEQAQMMNEFQQAYQKLNEIDSQSGSKGRQPHAERSDASGADAVEGMEMDERPSSSSSDDDYDDSDTYGDSGYDSVTEDGDGSYYSESPTFDEIPPELEEEMTGYGYGGF